MSKRKPQGARWTNYLTREELAKRWGISIITIARMDARGEVPSMFWGGMYLYHRKDVEEFEKHRLGHKREGKAPAAPAGKQTRDRLT